MKNFTEVINFALEKEAESATFYEFTSNLAEKPNVKAMFNKMMAEELKHKKMLEEIDVQQRPHYPIQNVIDLKISEYLTDVEFSQDMNYRDALVMAMKQEQKSLELYKGLAQKCDDQELQKLFEFLAGQEAKHKSNLEIEYDEYILNED